MALTVSITEKTVMGNKRVHRGTIAFDSSYPTGGESFTAANMGLATIDEVDFQSSSGYDFTYDHSNNKVLAYSGSTVTVTDDDNAATAGVAVYIDEDAASEAGKLRFVSPTDADASVALAVRSEVADTTDLSGVTGVRWIAWGR